MADYKHGEMDVAEQEKTFAGFMNMTTKGTILILAILVILAIFFR